MVFIWVHGVGVGVPEDTTLDAFTDADASTDDASDEDGGSVEADPVESTAAWSVTPVACPRCDGAVRRRYRTEDGQLVCGACKRW